MKILHKRKGKVFLVGAGPGDPELLTVKGARCIAQADVVVYDRLVHPGILDLAPAESERILAGKKGGHYSFPQEKINKLLAARARAGLRVVRLKGGDPFLFGRGGEEALFLLQHGIAFEVIPGVSSALAGPAAAGIPVTHRDVSSSVAFITGHSAAGAENSPRWDILAQSADTLVILMPLLNLRHIVSQLVLHGKSLETPAAIIQAATWENQKEVCSTLREIVSAVRRQKIESPALLVVGDVVRLGIDLKSRSHASEASSPDSIDRSIEETAGTRRL